MPKQTEDRREDNATPDDAHPTHEDGLVDVEANSRNLNTEVEKSGRGKASQTKSKA